MESLFAEESAVAKGPSVDSESQEERIAAAAPALPRACSRRTSASSRKSRSCVKERDRDWAHHAARTLSNASLLVRLSSGRERFPPPEPPASTRPAALQPEAVKSSAQIALSLQQLDATREQATQRVTLVKMTADMAEMEKWKTEDAKRAER